MPRIDRAALFAAVLFAALVVACSTDDPTPTPSPTPADPLTTIVTVEGTPPPAPGESDPPTATISFDGGGPAPMRIGTYCWGGICADAIGVITPLAPLAAAAGDAVTFGGEAFDDDLSAISLQLWTLPDATISVGDDWQAWRPETTATTLEVVDATAVLPADLTPGRYLASLFLSFTGGGDASYGVVIEIAP